MTHARELVWDGCLNVRDLGGHATTDGGETRFGEIIRADSVRQLSGDGWRALVEYGVTTVVDLRGDEERDEDPPAELAVDIVHAPFVEASEQERRQVDAEVEAVTAHNSIGAARTRDVYLIFLEHFRKNVARAIRAVAHAPEGGVVIHCAGGKDRTGLVAAFLLHVAGVDVEEIAADYALSEERLRPRTQAWLDAAETEAERDEILQISRTPAEVIAGVFHELGRRYGSVEGYLRRAGVGDEDLERVRARLRD